MTCTGEVDLVNSYGRPNSMVNRLWPRIAGDVDLHNLIDTQFAIQQSVAGRILPILERRSSISGPRSYKHGVTCTRCVPPRVEASA